MKLLLVFTGGTIESTENHGVIAPDASKPEILINLLTRHLGAFDYDTLRPHTILSENLDGSAISALVNCITSAIASSATSYDGIIITHGTDTLAYSAAALGYALGNSCPPVCVVSANHPLEHPSTNAEDNLLAAAKIIERQLPGVWVPYKNHGQEISIHRATRLIQISPFSDWLESAAASTFGYVTPDGSIVKNPAFAEHTDEIAPLPARLSARNRSVIKIDPYPGFLYPAAGIAKCVVHGTYHSGTTNTASVAAAVFFAEMKEKGIPVFLVGGLSGAGLYESAQVFEKMGAVVLPDIAPVAAYMKAWMATEAGLDIRSTMTSSLGGDFLASF